MIEIIICGESSDNELDTLVINNLSDPQNIIIHQSVSIPYSRFQNPIIIFKNSIKNVKYHNTIPSKSTCILNSENSYAANILAKQKISAISCGMSSKNTFTISSINYPKISISLQRQIYSINHNLIEPQEFIINATQEYDPYSILAFSAVTILLYSRINPKIVL